MPNFDPQLLNEFANERIEAFHSARLNRLKEIDLNKVLKRKNPYLFRAKDMRSAPEMIHSLLEAYLSSSEEELFGREFLESLAIRVSSEAANGRKSSASGIDLEFERENTRFLVSIKSGPNWGNNDQKRRLVQNFEQAMRVLQQGDATTHVQPVLGICYGRAKTTNLRNYIKYEGQSFWHFLSGDPALYTNLIEPVGYRAREHNESFQARRDRLEAQFIQEFSDGFCHADGTIDWSRLLRFNAGNM